MIGILGSEDEARTWCRDNTDASEFAQLERFAELVITNNATQNLIAPSTESSIWLRHIADSLQLCRIGAIENAPRDSVWIDIGSGAGFPGVVAAIAAPFRVNLVEPRRKRADYLAEIVTALSLSGETAITNAPVQKLHKVVQPLIITARAVAPLQKLVSLSRHLADSETIWLLQKGKKWVNELETLPALWQEMFHVKQSLTDLDARILVARGQFGGSNAHDRDRKPERRRR